MMRHTLPRLMLWARLAHDEALDAVDALADAWEHYIDEAQSAVETLMEAP